MGQHRRVMVYSFWFLAVALSLPLLVPSAAATSDKAWTEIRSPHFRVLTNGSTENALKVAREFEELRWVFANRLPGARLDSGASFLVFAVRDVETAESLVPGLRGADHIAGLFNHGWEKQFALVRLDTFGGNGAKEVVYHEYTHHILNMNFRWLPTWLDEGAAEFYGYTRFEEHKIFLGAPTVRSRVLHSHALNTIEQLMSVTPRSSLYSTEFFYAESWALVHFLIYGQGMEGGKKLDLFLSLLQQGMEQGKAFRQAFGEPKEMDKAFSNYLWVGSIDGMPQPFRATVLKGGPGINEKQFVVKTLSMAETRAELGSYHLWLHDPKGARALNEQALKDDPKLGLAHENMGFLDFADGKDAEATSEFSQAFALDQNLYLSLFAKTMLSSLADSHTVNDMNTFGATIGKVLQVNPEFAPGYVQLARLAVRENDLNAALLMSRKAEELEPTRAGYHLLTGRILLLMGKGSEAAATARFVADRWEGPDHNEAVELWNNVPAGQRSTADAILAVSPKDAQVVQGSVKAVTCGDKGADWKLVVDRGGRSLTFLRKGGFASGFSDTLWYGADHFTLCHHLEGMRVVVYYLPPTDNTHTGDVAEIEIRDDLPEPLSQH